MSVSKKNLNKPLDEVFYQKTLRPDRQRSYKLIAKYIKKYLKPDTESVIDYGCGAGWFLYYLRKYGVPDVVGLEPNKNIVKFLDASIKNDVSFRSLKRKINLNRRFDVAMNIEVIEHIDAKYGDTALENITRHSDYLVFSAATPGQGGYGHVNEQPFEYWEMKLNLLNFYCNKEETAKFRKYLKNKKAKKWYIKNISIFEKKV